MQAVHHPLPFSTGWRWEVCGFLHLEDLGWCGEQLVSGDPLWGVDLAIPPDPPESGAFRAAHLLVHHSPRRDDRPTAYDTVHNISFAWIPLAIMDASLNTSATLSSKVKTSVKNPSRIF